MFMFWVFVYLGMLHYLGTLQEFRHHSIVLFHCQVQVISTACYSIAIFHGRMLPASLLLKKCVRGHNIEECHSTYLRAVVASRIPWMLLGIIPFHLLTPKLIKEEVSKNVTRFLELAGRLNSKNDCYLSVDKVVAIILVMKIKILLGIPPPDPPATKEKESIGGVLHQSKKNSRHNDAAQSKSKSFHSCTNQDKKENIQEEPKSGLIKTQ